MPVVMGTAGHIDHGKTSLVKALTGIDCDRLSEEKKRGITIELGFAFLDLPDTSRLSIVDVPGHEKFVKNMVAGAAGIDFVLMVIAADEGIMPQTREHLDICTLLGVKTGLVALTKTDMVDEEWLAMVQEEVAEYLEPTFLAGCPIIPVSSRTGTGINALKQCLGTIKDSLTAQRRSDLARLPVDRVFTMKGHGTVCTGTLVGGKLNIGEELHLYPGEISARVRGLQSHGKSVDEAPAGRRTAVNLQGIDVQDVNRGDVLAPEQTLFPQKTWLVELTVLESSPLPLKHRKEIHFHHGSGEVLARVHLLNEEKIAPGETVVCQVRFPHPMVGVHGDRVVLRSFSPLRTIAGGRVLSPAEYKIKRFSSVAGSLQDLQSADAETLLLAQLALAEEKGLSFAELMTMVDLEAKSLEKLLQQMGGKQKIVLFDKEERRYALGNIAADLNDDLLQFLNDFHRREALKPGIARAELASSWGSKLSAKLFHFVVERAIKSGFLVLDQQVLRHRDHTVSLAADTAKLREEILAAYVHGGIRPPNLKDVLEPLGVSIKEASPVLDVLRDQGELIKVHGDLYYHGLALNDLRKRVLAFFATNKEMSARDFKDITELSRKFIIPVLEFFDKEKLTVRVGDVRLLRKTSASANSTED